MSLNMNMVPELARVLQFIGIVAMLIGALDPIEGCAIILPGSGVVAFGAHLAGSRRRRLLYVAFWLIALGVGALVLSTVMPRSAPAEASGWWRVFLLPYGAGWLLAVTVGILSLKEEKSRPHLAKSAAGLGR